MSSTLRGDVPVVILNTHYSGLAVGRDLGPLGIRVIGLSTIPRSPGNFSRWIEYRSAPDSLTRAAELLTYLLRLADELQAPAILLPTRDHDINFICNYRSVLDARFIVPLLSREALDRVMNKGLLAAAAHDAGVRIPAAVTVSTRDQLSTARSLRYPCVCKPLYASQWRKQGIWEAVGKQKALRVQTFEELETLYADFAALDPLVTVQEWVEGGEESLQIFGSYVSADHEMLAWFTARKRLQYPPHAGTGLVVEAITLPELEKPSRRLLSALRFRGISEIEYKRDFRDGQLYLIEVNPRHWDQHGLGTQVGVNLSEALYRDATGQPQRSMRQSNGRLLWVAEAEYFRHLARWLVGRSPSRDVLVPFVSNKTGATFDWQDLGPFLSVLGVPKPRWKAPRRVRDEASTR
jgi:predicted ATP-grasp superfamily ATP-dependent carboligase